MGGSGSTTRKITIINDEQSGVIKVSDAVVRRLKGETDPQNAAAVAPPSTAAIPSAPTTRPLEPQGVPSIPPPPPPPPHFEQPPMHFTPPAAEHGYSTRRSGTGLPYEELYQQAMHMRQERDEQIRKIDGRWRERVEAAERQNSLVENTLRDKYESTVTEVKQILPKSKCGSVCVDHENKVYECYKDNVKTSLNCSKVVGDFRHCVQEARLKALNKG